MSGQPPRRTQRKTHLDASVVPVERAFLARAQVLQDQVAEVARVTDVMTLLPWEIEAKFMLAREFRAVAEEFHWWG